MRMLLDAVLTLLAQTEGEKQMTLISVSLFALFMLILVIDSVTKQTLVPKNSNVKLFIIFLLICALIGIILLTIYYI